MLTAPARTSIERRGDVWIKREDRQVAGTVKYRMVHRKLETALEQGRVGPDTILTEVTAGSTGLALARAGHDAQLPVEIHVLESAAPAALARMRCLGARVVVHPRERPVREILAHVHALQARGSHWHLDQYDRDSTVASYDGLASELILQLVTSQVVPDRFVCGVGTGGLIQGVGAHLREAFPTIQVVAVEPAASVHLDGIRNTERLHMGAADPYDRGFPDRRIEITRGPWWIEGSRAAGPGVVVTLCPTADGEPS